ncbi:glycoside hydrolase superfamily [Rhexocercosporidium sp. MPI-PUGE-AT-0058]|nr:glycoside hydrolase superfamily [Rhexocercosporidium sp. MPI-PUGE-AT-0058]
MSYTAERYPNASIDLSFVKTSQGKFVAQPGYLDWRNFKASGVNLGSWFCLEYYMVPELFAKNGQGAEDEWSLCKTQGANIGDILEKHYKTFFTERDIDAFAAVGVNLLIIPTTYATWILQILNRVATYAIEKYDMHIVLDLYSLPGGVNWFDIGEAIGHREYKYLRTFRTDFALSPKAAGWLLKYFLGTIERVEAVNPNIPVMLQDSFRGEAFWELHIPRSANVVIDTHAYYFAGRDLDLEKVPVIIVEDAKRDRGTGTFPVLIGEWSLEAEFNNNLVLRKATFDAGRYLFDKYVRGSCFWAGKVLSHEIVHGEGVKRDFWSYEYLIRDVVVQPVHPDYKYE